MTMAADEVATGARLAISFAAIGLGDARTASRLMSSRFSLAASWSAAEAVEVSRMAAAVASWCSAMASEQKTSGGPG